jgi:hypothetical protein
MDESLIRRGVSYLKGPFRPVLLEFVHHRPDSPIPVRAVVALAGGDLALEVRVVDRRSLGGELCRERRERDARAEAVVALRRLGRSRRVGARAERFEILSHASTDECVPGALLVGDDGEKARTREKPHDR